MRRIFPLLIVAMISLSPAKDKKAEERIADLEKKVAELSQQLEGVDGSTRVTFKKVGRVLADLSDESIDLDTRMTRMERMMHTGEEDHGR